MRAVKKSVKAAPAQRKATATREARFVQDLITRGEAIPELGDSKVPPGVTHWLIEKGGKPTVKRVRFSIK